MPKKRSLLAALLATAALVVVPDRANEGAVATEADPCGEQVLRADGTPWECTFVDDFAGTELDRSKWLPQSDRYRSGSREAWACYVDSPDVLEVDEGVLTLRVVQDEVARPCAGYGGAPTPYRAGSVSTHDRFSQMYGRFEARIRATDTSEPGLQEAFWLWPDTRRHSTVLYPLTGEIDVAETYSRHPDLAIPFLHSATDLLGPVRGVNTAHCTATRGEWNTFVLEWGPDRLEVLVNGETCLVNTVNDPAFDQHYIVALTQMLGMRSNALTPATPLPAAMQVDHVKVWR